MFSFRFSLKERFYFSRTDFWLFSLTVRRLSAKQHKQVRLLQEPQLKIDKKNLKTFGSLKCFLYLCNVEDKKNKRYSLKDTRGERSRNTLM